MATMTYTNLVVPSTIYAYAPSAVTAANAARITVEYQAIGIVDSYIGSFTYGADGFPTGGAITGLEETYNGQSLFSVTGLQVTPAQFFRALLGLSLDSPFDLLFAGADSITGSTNAEALYGGAGQDTIIALDGDDLVEGEGGDDDLNGNIGNDAVGGGDGADVVRGGRGNDTIFGDAGDDPHVNGNLGDDSVAGGDGNDTVFGGQGLDTVLGEAGNDLISGDIGADSLLGGTGADRFVLRAGGGQDVIGDFSFSDGDRVQLSPGATYAITTVSGSAAIDLGGGDVMVLTGVSQASVNAAWIVFG